jgi:ribosomal protein S12 methylthiotransferase
MRGKHRSTPLAVLVREACELEAQGVVELNLISQDTTWYGRDLQRGAVPDDGEYFVGRSFAGMAGPHAPLEARGVADAGGERGGLLPELLRALLDATTIPWLRLFYMYPSGIQRELVELMAAQPRLLPYLDMPIQHGSDAVLRRMRRPERRATIRERVGWLRDALPDLTLRTTVIVGFPGESDAEFEELLELLEEVRFDRVGAFAYSIEEGTLAAGLPDPVADDVKRERLERLLDLQRAIGLERNERWVGRDTELLVDEVTVRESRGAPAVRSLVGRTRAQALEVDGVVHVADARGAAPGDRVRVRITQALEDDLIGEILDY